MFHCVQDLLREKPTFSCAGVSFSLPVTFRRFGSSVVRQEASVSWFNVSERLVRAAQASPSTESGRQKRISRWSTGTSTTDGQNKGLWSHTCPRGHGAVDGVTERQNQLNTCKVVAKAQRGSIQHVDIWTKVAVQQSLQSLETSRTFTEFKLFTPLLLAVRSTLQDLSVVLETLAVVEYLHWLHNKNTNKKVRRPLSTGKWSMGIVYNKTM